MLAPSFLLVAFSPAFSFALHAPAQRTVAPSIILPTSTAIFPIATPPPTLTGVVHHPRQNAGASAALTSAIAHESQVCTDDFSSTLSDVLSTYNSLQSVRGGHASVGLDDAGFHSFANNQASLKGARADCESAEMNADAVKDSIASEQKSSTSPSSSDSSQSDSSSSKSPSVSASPSISANSHQSSASSPSQVASSPSSPQSSSSSTPPNEALIQVRMGSNGALFGLVAIVALFVLA